MQFTRREFLIAGSVTAAKVAGGYGAPPQFVYAGADAGETQAIEQSVMTFCRQCPGGCGLRVRVVNDRVVGIAGNPLHPINRGGV